MKGRVMVSGTRAEFHDALSGVLDLPGGHGVRVPAAHALLECGALADAGELAVPRLAGQGAERAAAP